jgi:hypothetical protein
LPGLEAHLRQHLRWDRKHHRSSDLP